MIKMIFVYMLAFVVLCSFTYAAYYVKDPVSCPSVDAVNYPGQSCVPTDICGDISGIAQCYNTSTLTIPTSYNSSIQTQVLASLQAGYVNNCYATTTCTNAWLCQVNTTWYSTWHRTTICNSSYNTTLGSCLSGYNDCDLDGTTCEIQNGATCTVGTLTGTYSGCSGLVGNCVVSRSDFTTGTYREYMTNASESFLWGRDYGTGVLMNLTNNNYNKSFKINNSGCISWWDGSTTCSGNSTGTGALTANIASVGGLDNVDGFVATSTTATTATAQVQNSPVLRLQARLWNASDMLYNLRMLLEADNRSNINSSSFIIYMNYPWTANKTIINITINPNNYTTNIFTDIYDEGNLTVKGNITVTNISATNIKTTSLQTSGIGVTGNISTSGNITGQFFFGNGSNLIGVNYYNSIDNSTFPTACSAGYYLTDLHNPATCTRAMKTTGDTVSGNYTFEGGVLFIDSVNDRVGIGTLDVSNTLQVRHTSGTYGNAGIVSERYSNTDTISYGLYNLYQKWDLINIISTVRDYFGIHDVNNTRTPFMIITNSSTASIVVAPDTRIGIGTTTPSTNLYVDDVSGFNAYPITVKASSGSIFRRAGINYRIDTSDLWQTYADNNDSNKFVIQVINDSTRKVMVISTAGYVGIGTTNPISILNIETSQPTMILNATTVNGISELRLISEIAAGRQKWRIGTNLVANKNSMTFVNDSGQIAMEIEQRGNVGIGLQSAPNSRLEVYANTTNATAITASYSLATNEWVGYGFRGYTDVPNSIKSAIVHKRESTYGRGALVFLSDYTATADNVDMDDEKMRIQYSTGYVGIGTAAPTSKLEVTRAVNDSSGHTIDINNNVDIITGGTWYNRGMQILSYMNPTAAYPVNNTGYHRGIEVTTFVKNTTTKLSELTGIYVDYGAYGVGGADVISNITAARGITIVGYKTPTTNITTNYALVITQVQGESSRGIYVTGVTGSTSTYDLYMNDANAKNYFAGGVGINTTTALLGLLEVNGQVNGTSIYASGNISADDYLYHSPYPSDSYTNNKALTDLVRIKGNNGKIDHATLPPNTVSSIQKPVYNTTFKTKLITNIICNNITKPSTDQDTDITNETTEEKPDNTITTEICEDKSYNETIRTDVQIGTVQEEQTSIGMMLGNIIKSIQEIFTKQSEQEQRINILETELCKKDNTYAWCK